MSKDDIGPDMRRRVLDVLRPMAKAARKADERAAEHGVSGKASTGLGLTFDELRAARALYLELGGAP